MKHLFLKDLKTKKYLKKGNYNITMWFNENKIAISEAFKFLILPYTQNWKLRNLGFT